MILVVDLDGSLLKVDLFKESLGKSFLRKPRVFLKTVALAFKSRSEAKNFIAKIFRIEYSTLPYNNRIIDLINNYIGKGYKIILATGATHLYADPIANHLGLFTKVIATNEINNIGQNKLDAIINEVGNDFIYLGDSIKDLPIWMHCKKAILVGAKTNIIKKLIKNNVEIIDIVKKEKSNFRILLKQLRIHQWSKNLLLFVPALASHQIMMPGIFINALTGFIAFSLLASSIYVFNDIVDIDHDRKHPKNKNRPIAAGELSILSAYVILLVCLMGGGLLAQYLGNTFFLVVVIYIVLNLLYSFYLKKAIILDVILLMSFYIIRLIAGHTPDAIPLSPWLLSFSMFLFISLGFLKRYVDTMVIRENNASLLNGRGYSIDDGNMLMSLGVGSGLVSALVLTLYTGSEQVKVFYATPMLLLGLSPIMLYWISRIWLLAERGVIESDPVLFTIKDTHSYVVVFCFLSIILLSKYLVL